MQRQAVALARSNVTRMPSAAASCRSMERQQAAAGAQTSKAQVRLDYTEIHAPIPGVISVLAALQGEVVNIGQPIASIVNPDDLWVRADMPETFVDRVRLGDKLQVRFPDGMEREGTIFYRGVDADYATQRDVSQSKRDIKTFELRLRVDNSDRRLWPGLTAFVTVPAQDVRGCHRAAGIEIMENLPNQEKPVAAVEVEHLRKCFGSFCAVNDLNFSVAYGEVFGLLGPNGAGKSTLIRVLTTLLPPTSGIARILGFDVANTPTRSASASAIPQAMTSDLDLSAMETQGLFPVAPGQVQDRLMGQEKPGGFTARTEQVTSGSKRSAVLPIMTPGAAVRLTVPMTSKSMLNSRMHLRITSSGLPTLSARCTRSGSARDRCSVRSSWS